ncbi:HNH endonuclease signature motif containing protein [Mycolicibacterium hippocampi]|uniref:13E12 repeat family protein n=1 Tax=Mycolicibacterium hippocampi TaxID=659824 RepID=A0A850PMM9_9MYCO|nr:HNH endonuclease signature motif containing protein [Mycolicibacterium hippocampi]NVN51631.1 13E12 repeat family protein [Mycolicibacterium hippocampi]
MYVRSMSEAGLQEAVTALRAAFDAVAACDIDLLTRAELIGPLDDLQTLTCQLPSVSQRLLARLQTETTPQQLGAKSWKDVLTVRWRISAAEANRRLNEAAVLAPRRTITGEPLPAALPATAAAQDLGLITSEHVAVIRAAVTKLPGFVDAATAAQFEVDLVRVAVGVGPKELKETAALRLFLLDQDGPEPDDTERARTRGLSAGKQQRNGNIPVRGELTPEAWATLEAIFAKFAAPGMCNPDDPEPCTSGTPSQAQIDNDHRSLAQRQHDALVVIGRIALMSGLGDLNGLPVSIIIRTTLQDLESRAGVGVTGGGTIIPIKDVIRLGAHAHHSLAVFDGATGSALDLFRTKRIASPAQRLMLIARDGGCTKPCCTVGAYGTQVHHVTADWAAGGNTNIDDLGLACGPDNRLVNTHGGWTTRMNDRHEVEWIPPPGLDTGQTRINYYHRPEALLRPPEEPQAPEFAESRDLESAEPDSPDPASVTPEKRDPEPITPEQIDPQPSDHTSEPGGPAPPDNQAA